MPSSQKCRRGSHFDLRSDPALSCAKEITTSAPKPPTVFDVIMAKKNTHSKKVRRGSHHLDPKSDIVSSPASELINSAPKPSTVFDVNSPLSRLQITEASATNKKHPPIQNGDSASTSPYFGLKKRLSLPKPPAKVDAPNARIQKATAATAKAKPSALIEAASSSDASTPENDYFHTYSRLRIHESMLKDRVRTLTYRDAIMQNKHLFKDKVVLDVGCGTGILSLFAARAGARLVLAVDCADIASLAADVVQQNRFGHIIKVFHAKIETVELPVHAVDIIISEWMGYCLLFESMLDSVLFARDKWLKRDGLLFPDHCALYLAGISCNKLYHNATQFWSNVWDFDMSVMRRLSLSEGRVMTVAPDQVTTDVFQLRRFNLHTVKREDLRIAVPFRLKMIRDDQIHGLSTHFTVEFRCCHRPIMLSTSPMNPQTHWRQTVFFFCDPLRAKLGENVFGMFRLNQNRMFHRSMDISLDVVYRGAYESVQWKKIQYNVK